MIHAFSQRVLVYFVGGLIGLSAVLAYVLPRELGVALFDEPSLASFVMDLLRFLRSTLTVASVLLLILAHHRVVDCIWRTIPGLDRLVPNLNGRYDFEAGSNWPQKLRMLPPDRRPQSGMEQERAAADGTVTVRGTLTISAGLFRMRVRYQPDTQGPSRSHTEVVGAIIRQNPDSKEFELFYVFQGRVDKPEPTDDQFFYGAAVLDVIRDGGRVRELRGHYWTNRGWQRGLNTAGHVVAIRKAA